MENSMKCCPELPDGKKCDYLDFVYRLTHIATVSDNNRNHRLPVEVALHIRLERCTGPMSSATWSIARRSCPVKKYVYSVLTGAPDSLSTVKLSSLIAMSAWLKSNFIWIQWTASCRTWNLRIKAVLHQALQDHPPALPAPVASSKAFSVAHRSVYRGSIMRNRPAHSCANSMYMLNHLIIVRYR